MSSLNASINKFRSEYSEAAARNLQHSRPSTNTPAAARSSTPKPTDSKRNHETAFSSSSQPLPQGHSGSELLTQVVNAIRHLKEKAEKSNKPVTFDNLIGYLSLPNDAQKNIPLIKRALKENERVTFVPKAMSGLGKDAFKYRPTHPVTNAEELKDYLAAQPTAQGILVRELKDGWPDCALAIDDLEKQGFVLVARNKKDNSARVVWGDSPSYHILNPITQLPMKADQDFADVWARTKLPASETEIRAELEKAGLTPTSQVKEVKKTDGKKKEKRRMNRKTTRFTNNHLGGVLKDYSKK